MKKLKSIQDWVDRATKSDSSWSGNNLHIDEVDTLTNIKRSDWIKESLSVLLLMVNEIKLPKDYILFLHIPLLDTVEKYSIEVISPDWLQINADEFTPPSFFCTSLDYYNNFYLQELKILKITDKNLDFKFFFRTHFSQTEEMYLNECYIFPK